MSAQVMRSGFAWADESWRWLAFTESHYAYAPTAERALADLLELELE